RSPHVVHRRASHAVCGKDAECRGGHREGSMKLSRRDLLAAAAAASAAAGVPLRAARQPLSSTRTPASTPATVSDPVNLPIRDYLVREARRISDDALSVFKTPDDVTRTAADRRRRFMDMMGLADLPPAGRREPVPVHVTGVVDRPTYRIEKLHYE